MLLKANLFEDFFEAHLKSQKFVGTSPYILLPNAKGNKGNFPVRIETVRGWSIAKHYIKHFLWTLYTLGIWIQLIHGMGALPTPKILEGMLFTGGATILVFSNTLYIRRKEAVCALFNAMLTFESEYLPDQRKSCQSIMGKQMMNTLKFLRFVGDASPFMIAVCYPVMRWMEPCSPLTFGYFLLSTCNKSEWRGHGQMGIVDLSILTFCQSMLFYLFVDMMCGYFHQVFDIMFLQTLSFDYYLKYLQFDMETLKESGNDEAGLFSRSVDIYHQIQLMERFFNMIHQDGLVPIIIWAAPFTFILGSYSIISFGSQMEPAQLVIFPSIFLGGFLAMVIVAGRFGSVHDDSATFLEECRNSALLVIKNGRKRKLADKLIRSLFLVKIRIGAVNFVERLTPLELLDFSINQVVTLLCL